LKTTDAQEKPSALGFETGASLPEQACTCRTAEVDRFARVVMTPGAQPQVI
jgi:hypothetical protein